MSAAHRTSKGEKKEESEGWRHGQSLLLHPTECHVGDTWRCYSLTRAEPKLRRNCGARCVFPAGAESACTQRGAERHGVCEESGVFSVGRSGDRHPEG
ncbi:Trimethyllysine dioxygenase [Clarias magur]|uniref:Trimethyllysine dioxygenase n=1 Tax=Clarias magur TaxID=1594786 RepID=A0A8J4WZ08_CLAMG|nr:Trimethyllysine dioxygenase [Clarias magur]